ncbi:hypothetical protein K474DRAFT_1630635 [Panus rudis PR-1116 ss-1]|nr:hypothetical protein K474DRAFT_1630635 [Panus rudis PR-1116 ss-1]
MIPRVRTAYDMKDAIDKAASRLKPIGFDVFSLNAATKRLLYSYPSIIPNKRARNAYGTYSKSESDSNNLSSKSLYEHLPDELRDSYSGYGLLKEIDDELTAKVKPLCTLAKMSATYASGRFNDYRKPHTIQIKHGEFEYSGPIFSLQKRLESLYENASISGFGDVKKQTTEFDPDVRNAREIPASDFAPSANLLENVSKAWKEHFYSPNIRVEPYKIHIYGPEGMFRPHLDTPEKDLIGTFLVGLGDTTTPKRRLKVAEKSFSAASNKWVAFYPDTPHSVERIESGYRAVIAFKIFRAQNTTEETAVPTSVTSPEDPRAELISFIRQTAHALPDSTLILGLVHKYPKDVQELVGFDKLLHDELQRRTDIEVHLLPILVDYRYLSDDEEIEGNIIHSTVYPLTDAHLNYLLGDKNAIKHDEGIQWMKYLKETTPFYNLTEKWDHVWSDYEGDGPGYTGNESRGEDQHSVYLSYGLAILSKVAMNEAQSEHPHSDNKIESDNLYHDPDDESYDDEDDDSE